ncbi:MAG: DUF3014 domain-containing protein, partial [Hyphomonadaceae bacterium]|nr:DUF3014 domain-containing protein [Hyphomonadaceae bacterium]
MHLALSRSDEALVKASGGSPRTVRGMTLDPRMQFLEAQARQRAIPWDQMNVQILRAQTEAGAELFGGGRVSGVRVEKVYVTGRSHSVPCRLYLPTVRDNSAAMMVYLHFGGGVIGSLESCHRLCGLIAKQAGAPVLSVDYRLAPEFKYPTGLDDCIAAYSWAVDNAARYGALVRWIESVDMERAVALYARLYPLFQQAYEELGYPGRYFNDRLVAVIDHLLQAPEPASPVAVKLTAV